MVREAALALNEVTQRAYAFPHACAAIATQHATCVQIRSARSCMSTLPSSCSCWHRLGPCPESIGVIEVEVIVGYIYMYRAWTASLNRSFPFSASATRSSISISIFHKGLLLPLLRACGAITFSPKLARVDLLFLYLTVSFNCIVYRNSFFESSLPTTRTITIPSLSVASCIKNSQWQWSQWTIRACP